MQPRKPESMRLRPTQGHLEASLTSIQRIRHNVANQANYPFC